MKVVRKQLSQVSPQLYKQLYSLNCRDMGEMQGTLIFLRQEKEGLVHYILDGTELVGWSLLYEDWALRCQLYVRKNRRHKGYGRQLLLANVRYVRRLGKTFRVTLDDNNRAFFKGAKRSKCSKYSQSGRRLKTNEFA